MLGGIDWHLPWVPVPQYCYIVKATDGRYLASPDYNTFVSCDTEAYRFHDRQEANQKAAVLSGTVHAHVTL